MVGVFIFLLTYENNSVNLISCNVWQRNAAAVCFMCGLMYVRMLETYGTV